MLTPSTATACDTCREFVTHGTLLILGRVTAAVALAFILIGFSPATTYAQAPHCNGFEFDPFILPTFNGCTAEPVTITGRMTQVLCSRSDGNGGQHATLRIFVKGQGESPTLVPKKYVYNFEQIEELQNPSSGTFEDTFVLNWVMIRQAEDGTVPLFSDDDFLLKVTTHFTITPAGVPTAQVTNVHTSCP